MAIYRIAFIFDYGESGCFRDYSFKNDNGEAQYNRVP